MQRRLSLLLIGTGLIQLGAQADPVIEQTVVSGRQVNLLGEAVSASEGVVGQQEIALRPWLRSGEVLELVPGMVVTQHSGTGKANQYFLRGFNLDHGTDFATSIDHMPINMRTHGHGQGYTDLNFIIPELVGELRYRKGAYYADVGDFSSAGSAEFQTLTRTEKGLVEVSLGEDDYDRLLALDSVAVGAGELLYALEHTRYDGPWVDIEEDLDKYNAVLKYTQPLANGELSLQLMGYDNQWNSADQIPERAVRQGLIDELGSLDDSVGGESSRYSLSGSWHTDATTVAAYAIRYDMNLWSNFTYFLDDPVNGDQFEQVDERWIYGGEASHRWNTQVGQRTLTQTLGLDLRYDDIDEVGLYRSQRRQRLGVTRSDTVEELSAGVYWQGELQLSERLRSSLGLRYDYYDFDVATRADTNINGVDLRPNDGSADDDLLSAKGSLSYALSDQWELYAAVGQGFHSNDARGTTTVVDPADGAATDTVDPLVRSLGYEVGARLFASDRINASIALWSLTLDSELLFVGDAGNTEPSRESERQGVEFTLYYHINEQWTLDLEYAWTDAEFSERDPADPSLGDHIPGAVEDVLQLGLSADLDSGWFGALRLRHFGERPLEESGRITSDPSTVVNLKLGRHWQQWQASLDVLNLLDSDDHDIDYYYESQLAGELGPVEDVHYHVIEPRTIRLSLRYQFE